MQAKIEGAGRRFARLRKRFVGGRISRTTFAVRVGIMALALYTLSQPLVTILVPSSKTLRDVYLACFIVMAVICLIAFMSTYVKRMHDIGLTGSWAVLILLGLPAVIFYGSAVYERYRLSLDPVTNLSEFQTVISTVALALPLAIAMWRGQSGENRFGPAPEPIERFTASTMSLIICISTVLILVPVSIYAGLFQPGIWVGRGIMPPPVPMVESNIDGTTFMRCWNIRGVGAGSGRGELSGIYRDGYEGTVYHFMVLPDGQIDIVPTGNAFSKPYRSDGFRIVPYGMRLPSQNSQYVSVRGLNQFMLVAIYDSGPQESGVNYTSFAFERNEDLWPEYHVVMSTAISSYSPDAGPIDFPNARGKLMVGDCIAR